MKKIFSKLFLPVWFQIFGFVLLATLVPVDYVLLGLILLLLAEALVVLLLVCLETYSLRGQSEAKRTGFMNKALMVSAVSAFVLAAIYSSFLSWDSDGQLIFFAIVAAIIMQTHLGIALIGSIFAHFIGSKVTS